MLLTGLIRPGKQRIDIRVLGGIHTQQLGHIHLAEPTLMLRIQPGLTRLIALRVTNQRLEHLIAGSLGPLLQHQRQIPRQNGGRGRRATITDFSILAVPPRINRHVRTRRKNGHITIHHIRSGAQRPIGINRIHRYLSREIRIIQRHAHKIIGSRIGVVVTTRHKDNALAQRGHIRSHKIGCDINSGTK